MPANCAVSRQHRRDPPKLPRQTSSACLPSSALRPASRSASPSPLEGEGQGGGVAPRPCRHLPRPRPRSECDQPFPEQPDPIPDRPRQRRLHPALVCIHADRLAQPVEEPSEPAGEGVGEGGSAHERNRNMVWGKSQGEFSYGIGWQYALRAFHPCRATTVSGATCRRSAVVTYSAMAMAATAQAEYAAHRHAVAACGNRPGGRPNSPITATGGCLCGGVRYQIRGPLRDVVACHCSQCRRTTGNFVTATNVQNTDLSLSASGTLTWFAPPRAPARLLLPLWRRQPVLAPHHPGRRPTAIMAGSIDPPTHLRWPATSSSPASPTTTTSPTACPVRGMAAMMPARRIDVAA